MYSKERGYVNQPPAVRHPSYRQPQRPRMQVPPNYSGHAIVDGEERPLGRMEAPDPPVEATPAEGPIPRFDDLPRVSELGESRYRSPTLTLPTSPSDSSEWEESPLPDGEKGEAPAFAEDSSLDHEESLPPVGMPIVTEAEVKAREKESRPPTLFSLSRFPFGHGIGWEELLIMGLIWLLLHENVSDGRDRGDLDETVILLGLLLLLG